MHFGGFCQAEHVVPYAEKYDGADWTLAKPPHCFEVRSPKRVSSNDFNLLERLVDEKQGIALLPEYMARRPAWRRVLPDWQIESVPLHLLYYKNRGSVLVVRTFVEFVLEKVREAA